MEQGICKRCGKELQEVSKFCENRGVQIDDEQKITEYISYISELKDSKEGDIIKFGNYYGNTEWIVLKREGDILMLLSKDCINQKLYHTETNSVTWETCSLRRWLNEEYINEAFDGIEQQLIEETVIRNPDIIHKIERIDEMIIGENVIRHQEIIDQGSVEGGNDTKDKIFLLSLEEVEVLFTDEKSRIAEYFGNDRCYWWWLRSPGDSNTRAANIIWDGSINYSGYGVYDMNGGVRPVFYLNLSNLKNLEINPELIGTNRKMRDVNQELSQIQNASVGECVKYGSFLGNTTWKVLKKEEGKALLLSKDAVRFQLYLDGDEDITWEECLLRKWLNNTFLNRAFNEEERKQIVTTYVKNEDDPEHGTEGGADTGDYVFLLSMKEAEEYFADDKSRQLIDADGECCGWWWLRPSDNSDPALPCVLWDGSVGNYGLFCGGNDGAVRPALWVKLDS